MVISSAYCIRTNYRKQYSYLGVTAVGIKGTHYVFTFPECFGIIVLSQSRDRSHHVKTFTEKLGGHIMCYYKPSVLTMTGAQVVIHSNDFYHSSFSLPNRGFECSRKERLDLQVGSVS